MHNRDDILAASTSLLKDDPRVAEMIVAPPPAGSARARKLKMVISNINKIARELGPHPADPFAAIQKAASAILHSPARKDASLAGVVELTSPLDPVTRTYFALRAILRAVDDIGDLRAIDPNGPAQRYETELYTNAPRLAGRDECFDGYLVDVPGLAKAMSALASVSVDGDTEDLRVAVARACNVVFGNFYRPLAADFADAGDDWLEYLHAPDQSGHFTRRIVRAAERERNRQHREQARELLRNAQMPPAAANLISALEQIMGRHTDADGTVRHTVAARVVQRQWPALHRAAVREAGADRVNEAIRAAVERYNASLPIPQGFAFDFNPPADESEEQPAYRETSVHGKAKS